MRTGQGQRQQLADIALTGLTGPGREDPSRHEPILGFRIPAVELVIDEN
jgi:hypothetical protein